jgi:hypothetical protein
MRLENLFDSEIVRSILARSDFEAVAAVSLHNWIDLDVSTLWLERRWREEGRKYRRYIVASSRSARFEMDDDQVAMEFKLRFG